MPPRRKVPKNPLRSVKASIVAGDVVINPDVLQEANDDFGWWEDDIEACLLKLNDRYYYHDKLKNHFYKFAKHSKYPQENTFIDFYRAHKIMQGESIYTHIYIRQNSLILTVNSFKELYK